MTPIAFYLEQDLSSSRRDFLDINIPSASEPSFPFDHSAFYESIMENNDDSNFSLSSTSSPSHLHRTFKGAKTPLWKLPFKWRFDGGHEREENAENTSNQRFASSQAPIVATHSLRPPSSSFSFATDMLSYWRRKPLGSNRSNLPDANLPSCLSGLVDIRSLFTDKTPEALMTTLQSTLQQMDIHIERQTRFSIQCFAHIVLSKSSDAYPSSLLRNTHWLIWRRAAGKSTHRFSVSFVVKICRIKSKRDAYALDWKRLKGDAWLFRRVQDDCLDAIKNGE